jgi:SAM-dependent methyltransferase
MVRCLRLAERIGGLRETGIYLPPAAEEAARFMEARLPQGTKLLQQEPPPGSWDFILIDRLATTAGEYRRFSSWGVPIGLDEGGAVRGRFPFLIDTLPVLPGTSPANLADTGYLEVPPRMRERPGSINSVLVTFGGEDPAGLTEQCLSALLEAGYPPESITAVKGPLFGRDRSLQGHGAEGLHVLEAPASLFEQFALHDLVCTSFGLTAFEAAAAGALVLLINPSRYHRRLADAAGFLSAGTGRVKRRRFRKLLENPGQIAAAAQRAAPSDGRRLEALLMALQRPAAEGCPVCGRRDNTALLRGAERSFFSCSSCGAVYQLDFGKRGERYAEHYFFEEYRQQYGRSYLDDAPHIRELSAPRARRIRKLLAGRKPGEKLRLLDVGCAYGPFLQAAAAEGFIPEGTDISAAAAAYVRDELGFPAHVGDFEEFPASPPGRYAAVTMWFVIEHFPDADAVLRRAAALLPLGGVFAFSTPNLRGGTGRFYPRRFLSGSPYDHHTIWYPGMARSVLRRYGFRTEQVVITGHHPERLPGSGGSPGRFRRPVLAAVSRLAGLGDTFEIYARKIGEPQ